MHGVLKSNQSGVIDLLWPMAFRPISRIPLTFPPICQAGSCSWHVFGLCVVHPVTGVLRTVRVLEADPLAGLRGFLRFFLLATITCLGWVRPRHTDHHAASFSTRRGFRAW